MADTFATSTASLRELVRRNLPEQFVRAVYQALNEVYKTADAVIQSIETSFPDHQCGYLRWGLADAALIKAAQHAGLRVEQVPLGNGLAIAHVHAGEIIVIIRKVGPYNRTDPAVYRKTAAQSNQLALFDSPNTSGSKHIAITVELVHGHEGERGELGFLNARIPLPDDSVLDEFPLDRLYLPTGTTEGVESIADLPEIPAKKQIKRQTK